VPGGVTAGDDHHRLREVGDHGGARGQRRPAETVPAADHGDVDGGVDAEDVADVRGAVTSADAHGELTGDDVRVGDEVAPGVEQPAGSQSLVGGPERLDGDRDGEVGSGDVVDRERGRRHRDGDGPRSRCAGDAAGQRGPVDGHQEGHYPDEDDDGDGDEDSDGP
jgi:hypothetical protein